MTNRKDSPAPSMVNVLSNFHLTVDAYCAFVLKQLFVWKVGLDQIRLFPKEETIRTIDGEVEDLDVIMNYRAADMPSATAVVVEEHPAIGNVPGVQALLKMLAKNNQTGYLKGFNFGGRHDAFAWLMRQVHDIPMPGKTVEQRVRYWIEAFGQIIRTYLNFHAYLANSDIEALDVDGFVEVFPDIAATFGLDDQYSEVSLFLRDKPEAPLTLPGYLVALHMLGTGDDHDIREEYAFWTDAFKRADEVQDVAKDRAKEILRVLEQKPEPMSGSCHYFDAHFGRCVYVETDNEKVAAHLWPRLHRNVVVMLVRKKSGNVAIMGRNEAMMDFSDLHLNLSIDEPPCWHLYQPGVLLNGAEKRQAPRTAKPKDELIGLIRKHAKRRQYGVKHQPRH